MERFIVILLGMGALLGYVWWGAVDVNAQPGSGKRFEKREAQAGLDENVEDDFRAKRKKERLARGEGKVRGKKGGFGRGHKMGHGMRVEDPRFGKMVKLALMDPERVERHMAEKPDYQDKTPEQQAKLMRQLQMFRKRLDRKAKEFAEEFNLEVSEEDWPKFMRRYWSERVEIEKELRAEMEPKRQEMLWILSEDLKSSFQSK